MWDANWKFHHECAEQLSRVTEFSIRTSNITESFSCILYLRQSHLGLNTCYQIYAEITIFFDQEMSDAYPRCWRLKVWWKIDVNMTSKLASPRHARTPCKTKFPSPGRVHGNSGRVCKKLSDLGLYCLPRPVCLTVSILCHLPLILNLWLLLTYKTGNEYQLL